MPRSRPHRIEPILRSGEGGRHVQIVVGIGFRLAFVFALAEARQGGKGRQQREQNEVASARAPAHAERGLRAITTRLFPREWARTRSSSRAIGTTSRS